MSKGRMSIGVNQMTSLSVTLNTRTRAVVYFTLAVLAAHGVTSCLIAADRPNIIVFYTDDHGHADLSCQGVLDDIRTPHVDALARNGVLARHGYSTAPQCVPSRAGLLIGKFQSRFGVEANGHALDGFNQELTIAERLQAAGYVTAQFGKWHLGPGPQITDHGFRHVFNQNAGRPFAANITVDGQDRRMSSLAPEMYHIDACSHAAASLIDRYRDKPFFLYVAYRAPHVPLDAPQKYLDRFPGRMPERRRQALAMLSAVDDGVGLITGTLEKHQLTEKTLIFYVGDNGAPLKIHKHDAPGGGPGWDGSLNDPLNGEKGMLAEGGMHVPFVISWPGMIPEGQVYDHPVSALDIAATSAALAQVKVNPGDLDGVNLIPYLTGTEDSAPHDVLTWRWVGQSAIREGKWKLLRGGDREYLYDLHTDIEEQHNLASGHPMVAKRLRQKLSEWAAELDPPGLAAGGMSKAATDYFDFYLDGKPPAPVRSQPSDDRSLLWQIRNGELTRTDDGLKISGHPNGRQSAFLTRNGIRLPGPVEIKLSVRTEVAGHVTISWRTRDTPEFTAANRADVGMTRAGQWQDLKATIANTRDIVHVRVQFPGRVTLLRTLQLTPATGKPVTLGK